MASSSTAKESSASSPSFGSSGIKWEVFLSFRGEDTRNNFTDHLYTALIDKGICTYRDNERLERGKEILSELLKEIERSRVSIIVLSKNYASSTLCLKELAKIVECNDMKKQKVFPVFYKVNPSDIREQMGDFKTAFDKHEEDYKGNLETVQRWRSALTKVGNMFGWHLQDRSEAELIKLIIDTISRSLNPTFSKVGEDLVGIKSHLKKINDLLESGLDDIRFIGICGMGGIGKTTIARVLYESFSSGDEYQGSCFLADVREVSIKKGVVHLQEILLSKVLGEKWLNICDPDEGISYIRSRLCHKRVFVVLDDVDNQLKQLEKLAGEHNWFGSGSRIIITTRNKQVLISHGISSIYEVEGLKDADALKLFHMKAFRHGQPTNDHDKLSKQIIHYTSGLPLALQVLGSHLCGRTVKEWISALNRLRHVPHEEVLQELRISYDGLSETEKSIFLDIACFFKGKNKDRVMEILDGCDFDSTIGMRELLDKSLITISYHNKLGMHDLLQQMGWEIVRRANRDDRGQWSRLWLFKDVNQVLIENKGTHRVKGIMLDNKRRITHLNSESFSSMRNLRLLKIRNVDLSRDIEYLSNELRLLEWPEYPSNSLPSNFQPHKLFELNLCRSRIQYLWKGMKAFERLKTIKLSYSHKLIETPDFTRVPNLEMLDLEGCTRLRKVHDSVGLLERLITLNLKGCKNLVSFPINVSGLKLLKILNLQGCSKLDHLPQNLEELEVLEELDAGETAIRQVPPSIGRLSNLESLSFCGCKVQGWWSRKYLSLPHLSGLFGLKRLDLSDCGLLDGSLPNDLGSLCSLEELKLNNNNFVSLPDSIKRLSKLQILNVENCHRLQSLPELPPKIIFVGAEDCISLEDVSNALRGGTSPSFALHLFNCLKLHEYLGQENNLAIMLLKQYLQQPVSHSFQFHIRLPGFDIPEWFSCKIDGNSVHMGLPPDWLNDDFMGIAMCGVFKPALENLDCILRMRCTMYIMRKRYDFYFKIPSFKVVGSHHLWLAYMSRVTFECDTSPQLSLYSDPSYKDADDESDHVLVGGSTCIHASFRIEYKKSTGDGDDDNDDGHDGDGDGYYKRCKVFKCGIRLVYDKNYFQESSAAEGSVFHQKDNCSTGYPFSTRYFLVPTNSQDVHIVAYSMWPKWGVNNDNLYSPAKEPKGKQEQEGKHRMQPTKKRQQKQSKNRAENEKQTKLRPAADQHKSHTARCSSRSASVSASRSRPTQSSKCQRLKSTRA